MTKVYVLYHKRLDSYVVDMIESKFLGYTTVLFGSLFQALHVADSDLKHYLDILHDEYSYCIDDFKVVQLTSEMLMNAEDYRRPGYLNLNGRYSDTLISESTILSTGALSLSTNAIDCFGDNITIYYSDGIYTDDGYTNYNLSGYDEYWAKIGDIVKFYGCEVRDDDLVFVPVGSFDKESAVVRMVQCISAVEAFVLSQAKMHK